MIRPRRTAHVRIGHVIHTSMHMHSYVQTRNRSIAIRMQPCAFDAQRSRAQYACMQANFTQRRTNRSWSAADDENSTLGDDNRRHTHTRTDSDIQQNMCLLWLRRVVSSRRHRHDNVYKHRASHYFVIVIIMVAPSRPRPTLAHTHTYTRTREHARIRVHTQLLKLVRR